MLSIVLISLRSLEKLMVFEKNISLSDFKEKYYIFFFVLSK